ncbi:MAG: hypothetical protein LHV69_02725 [Elusimicrobia bacterium]|nr:hypothetical protein [Candidatus Obscuribacterium magneticum]
MIGFEDLFGLPPAKIKRRVVILPSADLSLFTDLKPKSISRGKFFSIANSRTASFLSTRFNFLVGDGVLGLKETLVEAIYLFGPCGGLPGCSVGEKVVLLEALNFESFSQMVKGERVAEPSRPDRTLTDQLLRFGRDYSIQPAKGATVSSLVLEELHAKELRRQGVTCLDMEASIVFSAATAIGRQAAALLYVADVINEKPFYKPLSAGDKARLQQGRKMLAQFLMDSMAR